MNLLSGSGRLAVGPIAPGVFDNLSTTTAIAPESGFVVVYVDNQTMGKDVWFDNVQVLHYNTQVLEENHYYPFGLTLSSTAIGVTEQPLKYQAKELEKSFGVEMYDFHARQYDPQIGRTWQVDPLSEHPKQIHTSPYAFLNNNPVRYVDPSGMIWEDPKQAERLRSRIDDRIESINKNTAKVQNEIETGKGKVLFFTVKLNAQQIQKRREKVSENAEKIGFLNQSLDDIDKIAESTETFRLTPPGREDGTHGIVKQENIINIEGSTTGLHIHEMRHVGQSIAAVGLKFNANRRLLNATNIPQGMRANEINAYKTQYSFDGTYPAGASSLSDINEESLRRIVTSDGRVVYQNLFR